MPFDVIDFFKEVLNPAGLRRKPRHNQYTKKELEVFINIEEVITHAKKLYKSMNRVTMSSIKKEFETKFNFDLEKLSKKYDMNIQSLPISKNTSQRSFTYTNISEYSEIRNFLV